MDVSDHPVPVKVNKQEEPDGPELIEQVVTLTGLPGSMVEKELHEILDLSGRSADNVTLDELRQAMLLYLEAIAETHGEPEKTEASGEELTAALLKASEDTPH